MRTEKELEQIKVLTRFGNKTYSREERYLLIFSRDLQKGFKAISEMGVDAARNEQLFYDFLICFEDLNAKMNEFRWSADFLAANGINFKEIRKLYFAVA